MATHSSPASLMRWDQMPVLESPSPSLPIYNHSMKTQAVLRTHFFFLISWLPDLGQRDGLLSMHWEGVQRIVCHKEPSCFLK